MAKYFPLFADLSNKTVLVVGAGPIAERRVRSILPFAGRVVIVARHKPEWVDDLGTESALPDRTEKDSGSLEFRAKPYSREDLDGASIVLACTDDKPLNAEITAAARGAGIPANNASDKTDCDFYFPGLVTCGPVVVGITASGEAHHLAKEIRERIEPVIGGILEEHREE